MAIPIIEQELGGANPYATTYIDEILKLTKSITVHCTLEALTFNDQVTDIHKKPVDVFDKRTWRYYKHLAGEYHEVDTPMRVISRDNREDILLTKENLKVHAETRREISLFGAFYDELISTYPEQSLLIRSMISTNKRLDINGIIKSKNWTIIGWVDQLVESQEKDLIPRLQERIHLYAIHNLMTNYALIEEYALGVMFVNLYNYIIKTIINLRLSNAKTNRAHSFHILNYLASHHGLDETYNYLDNYQRLFLYRNLLYLDSHAGRNDTLDTLIEKFFTYKRISITNHVLRQSNTLNEDLTMGYYFKQTLLNKENLVYNTETIGLNGLSSKEMLILPSNVKEYRFNRSEIDRGMYNTLTANALTKDLEVSLADSSDEVRYKLFDILLDYWAVTIDMGINSAFIEFLNPITGEMVELVPEDSFNLFVVAFHAAQDIHLETIPDYWAWRVFKEVVPETDFLMKYSQSKTTQTREDVEDMRVRIPSYRMIESRKTFSDFVVSIYKFELGMWIKHSSNGHLYDRYDLEKMFENTHEARVCSNGGETVRVFLDRVGLPDLNRYSKLQASDLLYALLSVVGDGVLDASEFNRLTQDAAVYILNKFKSYSTQTLSDYTGSDSILIGPTAPHFALAGDTTSEEIIVTTPNLVNCINSQHKELHQFDDALNITDHHRSGMLIRIEDTSLSNIEVREITYLGELEVGVEMRMTSNPPSLKNIDKETFDYLLPLLKDK